MHRPYTPVLLHISNYIATTHAVFRLQDHHCQNFNILLAVLSVSSRQETHNKDSEFRQLKFFCNFAAAPVRVLEKDSSRNAATNVQ